MLSTYTTRVQTILHDFNGSLYGSPLNLTAIINQARAKVALMGQCIRAIPPSSTSVGGYSIVSGGTGYTTATATITGPDLPNGVQATATVTLAGGAVSSLTISGGSGYVLPPTIVISGNGTGAALTLSLLQTPVTTFLAQELYTFSTINALTTLPAGVSYIQALFSVAVSQGNIRPVLKYMPFTEFQAMCRSYEGTTKDYPEIWTQYGQGASGSFYLFPVPSGTYSMDLDCVCIPIDLVTDSTVEAIPYPWTEAVPYYAAMLCYEYAQRLDDADKMQSKFMQKMNEARAFSSVAEIPDIYEDDD